MAYEEATKSPARYQFEPSSDPSESNNCGPTCITKIADFYRDAQFGIENTRRAIAGMGPYNVNGAYVWGAPTYTPTSPAQQRDMLIKRGVPAEVVQVDSLSQLRSLVRGGNRPVLIGVYMARVPASVRDHPFLGWHAITVLDTADVGGTTGFWVNDPNFSPPGGYRPDPDRGRKFYPDWVMNYAFIMNYPRWAVAPTKPKIVIPPAQKELPVEFRTPETPSWVRIEANRKVYDAPYLTAKVLKTIGDHMSQRHVLVGYTKGGRYKIDETHSSRTWAIYRMENPSPDDLFDGRFGYVPRKNVEVIPA